MLATSCRLVALPLRVGSPRCVGARQASPLRFSAPLPFPKSLEPDRHEILHAQENRKIKDTEAEIRRAWLVMDGLAALKEKSVETTRTLQERLAKRKLECLSGNTEA